MVLYTSLHAYTGTTVVTKATVVRQLSKLWFYLIPPTPYCVSIFKRDFTSLSVNLGRCVTVWLPAIRFMVYQVHLILL